MIRLTVPSIEQDDLAAVAEVLASGYLVQGPRVEGFERAVAERVGVRHAVAVTNCTAAIQMALLAADVRPGDLVVTTAYSWPATANAVELCGAQPVFADISPDTFNVDPEALAAALARLAACDETARRVKAVLPVHAFGLLADMPAITGLADEHGLAVVEDAACALGASLDGRQAGAWGALGCFSFHPRKAITTGEGGIITTDDAQTARRLRALRNHGLDPAAAAPDFVLPGFNNRMTELQGALGLTQMTKLDRVIDARRAAAARYDQLFAGSELRPPVSPDPSAHVYQSYVILLPARLAARRAGLIAEAKGRGIETTIGTWHMPLVTYYRSRYGFRPGDFPVADDVFARSVTLPLHERLTEAEQAEVAEFFLGCLA